MAGKQTRDSVTSISNKVVRVFDETINRHVIAMTVNGKIHVFEGTERKMIVRCPAPPSAVELYRRQNQGGHWQLWVSTQGGHVYCKTLLPSPSSTGNEMMETESGSNASAFDDLLNGCGDEYDPIFAGLLKGCGSKTDFTDFSTGPCTLPDDTCEICEKDRVLTCSVEVSCISCAKDYLSVVCEDRNETVVLVYATGDLEPQASRKVVLRLPVPRRGPRLEKKSAYRFSKLMTLTPDKENGLSSSHVYVPRHMFSMLFGWQTALRSLLVVICSLPDGSVYFLPLDRHNPQPSWQLLCVVDSPLVDLLSTQVNRTLSEREAVAAELHSALGLTVRTASHSVLDAVLAVGSSGKCCLIAAMPTLGADTFAADCRKVVAMFTLPGSGVNCACCRDNVLYLSRLSQSRVEKCGLTLARQVGSDGKAMFIVDVETEHLFSASVSSLWFSGRENTLVCQTVSGDLIEVDSTPAAGEEEGTKAAGRQPSLKDLLLGVDINQTRLDQLKNTQTQHNAFLQQMNVAACLLHQGQRQHFVGGQKAAPVTCKVSVQSEVSYSAVSYHLRVELTNCSAVTLTEDWSLVVALREVTGRRDSTLAEHRERDLQSAQEVLPSTHSFPLSQELGAQCRVSFRIPLAYSPTTCGVKVDVSLVLRFPKPLQKEAACEQDPCRGGCLFVPLSGWEVDVFHFLHQKQAGNALPLTADPGSRVERRVAELKRGGHNPLLSEARPAGQIYSISQRVAAPAVKGFSTPVETLRALLTDSQVKSEQLNHPTCSLQAPCGSVLMVCVEPTSTPPTAPVTASPPGSSSEQDSGVCTVTMKSANISLLARARLALTRKLQIFGSGDRDVSVEEFRKMIQKTEAFLQQLQDIQAKWGKGDNSLKGTLSELCVMYETIQQDSV